MVPTFLASYRLLAQIYICKPRGAGKLCQVPLVREKLILELSLSYGETLHSWVALSKSCRQAQCTILVHTLARGINLSIAIAWVELYLMS